MTVYTRSINWITGFERIFAYDGQKFYYARESEHAYRSDSFGGSDDGMRPGYAAAGFYTVGECSSVPDAAKEDLLTKYAEAQQRTDPYPE